jgi:hypothetical protein
LKRLNAFNPSGAPDLGEQSIYKQIGYSRVEQLENAPEFDSMQTEPAAARV